MPIRVQAGNRVVEFPDGTTEDVMRQALTQLPAEDGAATESVPKPSVVTLPWEPESYAGGAVKGAIEGGVSGAKGFVKGVVPGAAKAVLHTIPSLVQAALGAVKGTVNLASDPVSTLTDAYEAVKGIPGQAKDQMSAALDAARNDPEGFGRTMGELTGATAAGIGGARLVPLAPKPIAKKVGGFLSTVGKEGKWPIRMIGAHQLGSGNIQGLGTIMAPEILQKSGAALTRFGTGGPPPIPVNRPLTTFQADVEKELTATLGKAGGGLRLGLSDIDKAIGVARKDAAQARASSARLETRMRAAETSADVAQLRKELAAQKTIEKAAENAAVEAEKAAANAATLRDIQHAREGREARTPSFSKSISAKTPEGGRESMRQSFTSPADAAPTYTAAEQDLLRRATSVGPPSKTGIPARSMPPQPPGSKTAVQGPQAPSYEQQLAIREAGLPAIESFEGVAAVRPGELPPPGLTIDAPPYTPRPVPVKKGNVLDADFEAQLQQMEAGQPAFTSEGVAAVRPGELPPPGLTIDAPEVPLRPEPAIQNRLDAFAQSSSIRPTRSSSARGAGVKLSPGDEMRLVQIVEQNPGIDIARATELLEAERAAASSATRSNARLDAGARRAAERDIP